MTSCVAWLYVADFPLGSFLLRLDVVFANVIKPRGWEPFQFPTKNGTLSKLSAFPRLRVERIAWNAVARWLEKVAGCLPPFQQRTNHWIRRRGAPVDGFAPSPATKAAGFSPRSKLCSGHRRASGVGRRSHRNTRLPRDRLGESSLIVTEGPSRLPSADSSDQTESAADSGTCQQLWDTRELHLVSLDYGGETREVGAIDVNIDQDLVA